jgi:hypothetical protein
MSDNQGPPPGVPNPGAIAPGAAPAGVPAPPAGVISAEPMNLAPIPLTPPPKPTLAAPAKKEPEIKDTFRELIETIVFVVVLVLMLKTFLAEAFVIPTGSMADTLLGYQHNVTCKQCGKPNLINASSEADPQGSSPQPVVEWKCENCQFPNKMQ